MSFLPLRTLRTRLTLLRSTGYTVSSSKNAFATVTLLRSDLRHNSGGRALCRTGPPGPWPPYYFELQALSVILVLGQEQTQSLRGKRSPDLTTLHRKRIFENAERRFGAVKAESTGALPTWCAFRSPGRGLMGESEAKILTNTPRTRKPDAQHQADMEILRQQLLDEIAIPVHGSAPARARRSI